MAFHLPSLSTLNYGYSPAAGAVRPAGLHLRFFFVVVVVAVVPAGAERRLARLWQRGALAGEHRGHRRHGGPALRLLLHAQQPDLDALEHLRRVGRLRDGVVDELQALAVLPQPPRLHAETETKLVAMSSKSKVEIVGTAALSEGVDQNSKNHTHISEEVEVKLGVVEPSVLLPADDLQHQDAEAEHVGFHGEDSVHGVFRRHVPTASESNKSITTITNSLIN